MSNPLHSTMYLFLLLCPSSSCTCSIFTFHNVSISTRIPGEGILHHAAFTFHNVSISTPNTPPIFLPLKHLYIPQCIYFYLMVYVSLHSFQPLHSTMYLFLPKHPLSHTFAGILFTFHNVSISTRFYSLY